MMNDGYFWERERRRRALRLYIRTALEDVLRGAWYALVAASVAGLIYMGWTGATANAADGATQGEVAE